jgi:predicted metal-binding membrane protein
MVLLVVTGMMRLGTMALVAAAITLERLAPRPERVARAAGVAVLAAAGLVIVRALGAA